MGTTWGLRLGFKAEGLIAKTFEKNFNYLNKSFGRIKRVVTFAAPKEGKQLQRRRNLEKEFVTQNIKYGSAFRIKQVLIFYGKFFEILKQKNK
jgi:hypothetical protein